MVDGGQDPHPGPGYVGGGQRGRGSKESWFNKQGVSTDNSKEALNLNSDDGLTTL